MLSFDTKTGKLLIKNGQDYVIAKELLYKVRNGGFLPDDAVLNAWFEFNGIESHNRIVTTAISFVPSLMASMIKFLEKDTIFE